MKTKESDQEVLDRINQVLPLAEAEHPYQVKLIFPDHIVIRKRKLWVLNMNL
jgi:hypothetical protein